MRYKYKIGDTVLVHNIANIGLDNKIGIVIDRKHSCASAFIVRMSTKSTFTVRTNDYKLVVCGIPDFPIWFSETSIRKFE
jgi:hypothetical protein